MVLGPRPTSFSSLGVMKLTKEVGDTEMLVTLEPDGALDMQGGDKQAPSAER